MLTAQENKALTEVGRGKPMGEFMRRYWIPAAKSEEMPSARRRARPGQAARRTPRAVPVAATASSA